MGVDKRTLENLAQNLVDLNVEATLELTRECLKTGIPAHEILARGLSKGMETVGKRFENNEYFMAELLTAAYIMNEAMNVLESRLAAEVEKVERAGTVVIGTVEGDLHDIGKNIVTAMLRAAGFEVHDLGIDVPAKTFVRWVREIRPNILGLSALLTTTIPKIREVVDALKEEELRDQVYIVIGGRPTNERVAEESGADAYCKDAVEAVKLFKFRIQSISCNLAHCKSASGS